MAVDVPPFLFPHPRNGSSEPSLWAARNAAHFFIRLRGLERNTRRATGVAVRTYTYEEATMGFGRGALLWLLGVPLPIIILLALFWHH
jgi:hypothetical protein